MGEPGLIELAAHAKSDELRQVDLNDPKEGLNGKPALGINREKMADGGNTKVLQGETFVRLSEARCGFCEAGKERT